MKNEEFAEFEEQARRQSQTSRKNQAFSALLCVALCVACLAAAFFFVKHSRPAEREISLLSGEDVGRLVAVSGRLAAPASRETGFYGVLCAGASCVSFFASASVAREISNSRINLETLENGAVLRVEGVVREDERSDARSGWLGVRIEVVYADGLELLRGRLHG